MQGTILVVEDEAAIRNVVRTYLESAGFTVHTVDRGDQALEAARLSRPGPGRARSDAAGHGRHGGHGTTA